MQYGTSWTLDTLWVVGVSGFAGLRNLEQVNAGVVGLDFGVVRRSRDTPALWGCSWPTSDSKRTSQASCPMDDWLTTCSLV